MKTIFFFTILSLFSQNLYAANFSVTPLFIEIDTASNKKIQFEINIESDEKLDLEFSLYKAKQMKNGKLEFIKTNNPKHIKFDKSEYSFKRNGSWKLTGTYKPQRSNQSSTDIYSVMIEEKKDKEQKGVNIKVRYAVVLKAENSQIRTYEKAKFTHFGLNNSYFYVDFHNQSIKEQKIEAEYKIRNQKNKVVKKGIILSPSALQKGSKRSVIFPMNTVMLMGDLTGLESKKKYSLHIRGKINEKKSIYFKKDFTSPKKKRKKKSTQAKYEVFPKDLKVNLDKNKKGLYRFKIKNNQNSDKSIDFSSSNKSVKFIPNKVLINKNSHKYVIVKISDYKKKKNESFSFNDGKFKKNLNLQFLTRAGK